MSGIVPIDWIQKKSWISDGFTWSISIDLLRTKLLLIDKKHWHVWKQEWKLRMESYLFILVMAVRSSTKPFVVSKTNESTFMCHFMAHSDGSNQCKASKLVGHDSHPRHGTFCQKVSLNLDPPLRTFQISSFFLYKQNSRCHNVC